jgi:hypothetical protein|tara:strand:+ start:273 stop:824 length:552 start_codon:yes stop_codon:yes gene_type:complete
MKTVLLNDILSDEELFFLYNEVTRTSCWSVCTTSDVRKYASNTNFSGGAMLCAMNSDEEIINYPLYLYGQTLVYRIAKLLEKKNIGVHTKLKRMWFVSTPTGSPMHYLHSDEKHSFHQSILLFITPVWKTGWRGSFHVDGEKFKFQPGSAVIFNSSEYHTGEDPISETYNWQRVTLNMVVASK